MFMKNNFARYCVHTVFSFLLWELQCPPEKVRSFLRFIPADDEEAVAFKLVGKPEGETWDEIIVVLNPLAKPTTVKVHQGEYRVACMDGRVSADPARPLATMTGGVLTVSPCSALIAYR